MYKLKMIDHIETIRHLLLPLTHTSTEVQTDTDRYIFVIYNAKGDNLLDILACKHTYSIAIVSD